MRLFHTTRCSKSRGALSLLVEAGYDPTLILYQEEGVLTVELLEELQRKTGLALIDLLRKGEAQWPEASKLNGEALRDFVLQHPILLERPILVVGERAVVARPPENVWQLVDESGPA